MRTILFILAFFLTGAALGQQLPRAAGAMLKNPGEKTRTDPLKPLVEQAGLVFIGKVVGIEYPKQADSQDTVRIYFRVNDGLRGVHADEVIVIEEWKGLWTPGHVRYRVGDEFAMICYARNSLGITSPVGGDRGRIRLRPDGEAQSRAMRLRTSESQSPSSLLDRLRALTKAP